MAQPRPPLGRNLSDEPDTAQNTERSSAMLVDLQAHQIDTLSYAVLRTLQKAAEAAPLPDLRHAANLTIGILQMAPDAHGNFQPLIEEALTLVLDVMSEWKDQARVGCQIPPHLTHRMSTVLRRIIRIHQLVMTLPRFRVVPVQTSASEILRCCTALREAFDLFGIPSQNMTEAGTTSESRISLQQHLRRHALSEVHAPADPHRQSDRHDNTSSHPPTIHYHYHVQGDFFNGPIYSSAVGGRTNSNKIDNSRPQR